ncbi:type VI secretion system membrane subunit TssM [Marinobacter zhanjiangensis]|uniref:Type VI secretion protein IcmF n=1 Tax=Marinobacter zhanjiangensis TaxID=578215 RepID=A0ABQ3B2F7_9GAMM|nr:type VI secretion system membrane subunit TssM [Marinobacter zhanjiangensis]GGY71974.1 type VI secretion protein IcmF [Marinobacter zhanjiangensis]
MAWIRRITGFFTWRRVFLFLGLLALVLLIWFGGPLLAIADYKPLASVAARLVFLLSLVIVFLAVSLWRARRQRKDNEKVVTEMMAGNDQDELLKEEMETQRNNLRKALALMKQWKPGRFRSVYELPWYMIIGAPGSGKSTALLNSGLEFPLKSEMGLDSVKGVGGTRYCDWWFTNRAVIIDTAGRYTTQESGDKRDAKGWKSFLGLLRKYRSRQPINGVILSVSVADLLEQTPTERQLHARALKQRVQELRNRLGVVFPVYVLLTKFDLLEGFSDTFAMLSEQEREEVFGITFDLHSVRDAEQLPAMFEQEFNSLLERLSHFLLHRLQQERTPETRRRIYQFPKQVALLKAPLWNLMKEVFFPSAYEEVPLLRGIYLVSSEQDGRTSDKVSSLVDRQLRLNVPGKARPANGLPSDGFFLHRLFDSIIFSEYGLAMADGAKDRRYRRLRQVAVAAMVLVTAGIGASWYMEYQWSRDLIAGYRDDMNQLQDDMSRLKTSDGNWLVLNDTLNTAAGMPGVMGTLLPEGGNYPLGFFQNGSLAQAAEGAYGRLLQYRFAEAFRETMESEISSNLGNLEYLYESLKTYLMVSNREHFQQEQVAAWFEFMLGRQIPGEVNRPSREELDRHLGQYLALNHNIPADRELVSRARGELTAMPLDERAYQRIRADALSAGLPEFTVNKVLGTVAEEIFERRSGASMRDGVPGLYTANGYRGVFEPERDQIVGHLLQDSWVYGEETEDFRNLNEGRIRQLVEDRYFRDYIHVWEQLLSDLRVRRFNSSREGRYLMSLLAGLEDPVGRLVEAVRYNTRLSVEEQQDPATGEALDNASDMAQEGLRRRSRAFDRMSRIMPESVIAEHELTPVDRAFRPLHEVSEETLGTIRDRARTMARYLAEQDQGMSDAFATVSRSDFENAVKTLHAAVGNSQSPQLQTWLGEVPGDARRLVKVSSTRRVNNVWRSNVYREYQQAIAGQYPLAREAESEVALADFAAFFGYGGALDTYFQEHVAEHVDTGTSPWTLSPAAGIRQSSLQVFRQARRIREAFFINGTQELKASFTLKPAYLDGRLASLKLRIGDRTLNYRHGPPRTMAFDWPMSSGSGVRVTLTRGTGTDTAIQAKFDGDWALFRFLGAYGGLSGSGRTRNVDILSDGYLATLEMTPDSVKHPFDLSVLHDFRLPSRL